MIDGAAHLYTCFKLFIWLRQRQVGHLYTKTGAGAEMDE